jgi:hypothetical protein
MPIKPNTRLYSARQCETKLHWRAGRGRPPQAAARRAGLDRSGRLHTISVWMRPSDVMRGSLGWWMERRRHSYA